MKSSCDGSVVENSSRGWHRDFGTNIRQAQYKSRGAAGGFLETDVASQLTSQAPSDGQSQAAATTCFSAGVKRIEHVLAFAALQAGSVVLDDHFQAASLG